MRVITNIEDFKKFRSDLWTESVGFVPTMGALHKGHFSLVEKSVEDNEVTLVSIYINETQFNNPNDLENYPREFDADLKSIEKLGVDVVFLPNYQEMYPDNYRYKVIETEESLQLCGEDRPGHFDGVLTVVMKLFNLVRPQKAYFGEKDFQQLSLIKGMVESLFMNVEIVACPIVRDESGLALSSRNARLSKQELETARQFAEQLKTAENLELLKEQLIKQNIEVNYLTEKDGRRFAAVQIGPVRLIDNVEI